MNNKGLTLNELMIVLAIIAITAAVAVPMYVSDLPRQKAKAAAQSLLTDLRVARARAVANNQGYLVCFDSSTTYKLASGGTNTTSCASLPAGQIDKAVDFRTNHDGVQFAVGTIGGACPGANTTNPISFVNNIARFSKRGSSVDGSNTFYSGVVYLTNIRDSKQSTYCIDVEGTTGRAKLYAWAKGAWK